MIRTFGATALAALFVVVAACTAGRLMRKSVGDPCASTLKDCSYGLECRVPLPVSAPFHCSLMEPVKPRLREVLMGLHLSRPSAPIVANASGQPNEDPGRIVDLLVEQVTSPVRWVETIQGMARDGVDTLVEFGPGKVLTGLARRIDRGLRTFSVEDPAGLAAALKEIAG